MDKEQNHRIRPAAMIGPLVVLALFLAVLTVILHLAVPLPLGPGYWDLSVYLDAAQRINSGQIYSLDFSAPGGPLPYHLFAEAYERLPDAHPLLLAQWVPLVVAAPVMAVILMDLAPHSRAAAWAILLPFLLFGALPVSLAPPFLMAGPEVPVGRQGALLFYLLAVSLVLVRHPLPLSLSAGSALTALFLTSIPGFLAGCLLYAYAILAGRIRWSVLLISLVIFYGLLGWLEYSTGLVSAHIQDFVRISRASDSLLQDRLLPALGLHLPVLASALLLVATLVWFDRQQMLAAYSENVTYLGRKRALHAIFNAPAAWVVILALAAWLYESQQTGGHALLALWPGVWLVLRQMEKFRPGQRAAIATLCAACMLPPMVSLLHQTARAAVAMPTAQEAEFRHLGNLGRITIRPRMLAEAEPLEAHQTRHRRAYMALAEEGIGQIFAQGTAMQLGWLRELDRLAAALLDWEEQQDRRLETLHLADHADPLAALLDRTGPRGIYIGTATDRRQTRMSSAEMEALRNVDAIFLPRCPETALRLSWRTRLMPVLEGRQAIDLTPCHTMMLKREMQ